MANQTLAATNEELHIPEGINYDCQGCGICCSGWSVNMTKEDYERVSSVDWGELSPDYKGRKMFRELKPTERAGTNYTHRINSKGDTCPFLVNKLCFIHGQKGGPFKPTICQQFPYAFTPTPSGIYATVSFVSMAVLYNQGTPLTEQRETLVKKLADFRMLYPQFQPDWSKIQLSVEQPMTWDEYMRHEGELMKRLEDKSLKLTDRLRNCCDYLADEVAKTPRGASRAAAAAKNTETNANEAVNSADSETANSGSAAGGGASSGPVSSGLSKLNKLDKHLLSTFHKMYFPPRAHRIPFNVPKFWLKVFFNSSTLYEFPSEIYAIDQIKDVPFPEDDPVIEDMLYRYIYSLIFGKKYFGAGFGHLSLITGFHHVVLAYTLAKIHARGLAKQRQAPVVSLIDMVATLKQLETQMGELMIGPYAASTLELLLQSPARAKRLLTIA